MTRSRASRKLIDAAIVANLATAATEIVSVRDHHVPTGSRRLGNPSWNTFDNSSRINVAVALFV